MKPDDSLWEAGDVVKKKSVKILVHGRKLKFRKNSL
jgi:hypothetical protein